MLKRHTFYPVDLSVLKCDVQLLLDLLDNDNTEAHCEAECHKLIQEGHLFTYGCPLVCHAYVVLFSSFLMFAPFTTLTMSYQGGQLILLTPFLGLVADTSATSTACKVLSRNRAWPCLSQGKVHRVPTKILAMHVCKCDTKKQLLIQFFYSTFEYVLHVFL